AKIGAEVAKKGSGNEEIMKKSLEGNSDAYAYAPMVTCVRDASHKAGSKSLNFSKQEFVADSSEPTMGVESRFKKSATKLATS
ncbi:hypothetical protein PIB30_099503, partial [Stylosanthes scabra]|nr:hypothetical protein [Stylosanthes scabra]